MIEKRVINIYGCNLNAVFTADGEVVEIKSSENIIGIVDPHILEKIEREHENRKA